ncbi:MAG: hypothetical protein OXC63_01520 [Aestuariivita sp.]|nr:hypothetical protein [Aestuariivita sp.]
MSEADELPESAFELEIDQIELRHLVIQSTDKITAKVNENTMQMMANKEAINQLNAIVLDI